MNSAAGAKDFRRHCAVGTASWYLVSLEHDVDAMLQNIWPLGLAMFCGDISESINRFLKHGHNEHINREGGGAFTNKFNAFSIFLVLLSIERVQLDAACISLWALSVSNSESHESGGA